MNESFRQTRVLNQLLTHSVNRKKSVLNVHVTWERYVIHGKREVVISNYLLSRSSSGKTLLCYSSKADRDGKDRKQNFQCFCDAGKDVKARLSERKPKRKLASN